MPPGVSRSSDFPEAASTTTDFWLLVPPMPSSSMTGRGSSSFFTMPTGRTFIRAEIGLPWKAPESMAHLKAPIALLRK